MHETTLLSYCRNQVASSKDPAPPSPRRLSGQPQATPGITPRQLSGRYHQAALPGSYQADVRKLPGRYQAIRQLSVRFQQKVPDKYHASTRPCGDTEAAATHARGNHLLPTSRA
eukprot:6180495-Pleurochrysis_carterae.AAC.3